MEEENNITELTQDSANIRPTTIEELQGHMYGAERAIMNILLAFMQRTGVAVEDIKFYSDDDGTHISLLVGSKQITFIDSEGTE